jgi:RNA polymerase sigma-70 factor, ECF subfamily
MGRYTATIPAMSDRDDHEVVERVAERDEAALRDVVEAHGAVVYGLARRILGDTALAEEVAQDTFLALWRRPGSFDPDKGSLQGFLLGVARNKAVDAVRKEERFARTASALLAEAPMRSVVSGESEHVDSKEELGSALAELPEPQKEALVLAYYGGRTYREVAEELGIPEGTAKSRLRQGLAAMRSHIERTRKAT